MPDDIVIEQMRLSDKAELLAFLKAAFPDNPRQSDAGHWDWHFLKHPYSEPDNIPVWLAKSGGHVVAQLATIPVEMNLDGESVRAIWILDLIVAPDFRRRGIMKRMFDIVMAQYPFGLGVATDKQHSVAMVRGWDWAIFPKIPRYHRLLFPGTASRDLSRLKPLRTAADLAFAPFRPRRNRSHVGPNMVRAVESFDESFDRLWAECRGQWKCSISRSAAFLNWQFREQPGKRFDVLGYYDGDRLLGYAVMFFRRENRQGAIDKAAISDICYHPSAPGQIVDALLEAALQLCLERRAGGLVTDTFDPFLQQRLKRFGFWNVKTRLEMLAKVPEGYEFAYDPANWFLTRGDSDISIFEHPNQ